MKLLLASGSETRRRMLADAGIPFDWARPKADEEAEKARLVGAGAGAAALSQGLADLKALSPPANPEILVLGSDQVLEQADGSILSKAGTRGDAERQLRGLSGRPHRLHSAAALARQGEIVWRALETATLHVRELSPAFLDLYLAREYREVRFNVGVYRIEGMGVQLFERIEGSHFAILGLPLLPLLAELRRRGVVTS